MPPSPRIHNLGHNKIERTPARWFVWDTETRALDTDAGEVHHLRLWCAALIERQGPSRKRPRPLDFSGTTSDALADAVESACKGDERLTLCAHNQAFDLVVTQLPLVLAARGWEVTQHAVTGTSPWLRMRRGHAGLTFVDSASYLPTSLEAIGDALDVPKLPLPAWGDDDSAWFDRCRRDVAILGRAMMQLLDWWDANRLGCWSITGPGTGWNSYKHLGFRSPVVIDPEPTRRAVERSALYAGRAEAFRVGQLRRGDYVLVDFAHAFGSICAHMLLPRRLLREFDALDVDGGRVEYHGGAMLAECEVETSTPRYPLRTRAGIVYPVGRFATVLAGPEIAEAFDRGELRAVGHGYEYALSDHMARWGRWALSIVDGQDATAPPMAQLAVKSWTRTVPGRWGARTSRTALTLDQPIPGWRVEQGVHNPGGVPCSVLDMAGKRYWLVRDAEGDNAFPAVLAWIQSYVRVRLSRLIDLVGVDAVVTCNTDGALIDLRAFARQHDPGAPWGSVRRWRIALADFLDRAGDDLWPLTPRIKGTARSVEVLSPQHLVADGNWQLAGVPRRGTVREGGHRYTFTDWPRLTTQLQAPAEGYARRRRTVDLSAVMVPRWTHEDGRTTPPEAAGTLGGGSAVLPWRVGRPRASQAPLRASQHRALPAAPAPEAEAAAC